MKPCITLLAALLLTAGAHPQAEEKTESAPRGFIGDTGSGWDTTSAVKVKFSSEHPVARAVHMLDGSGIWGNGLMHDGAVPEEHFVSGPLTDSLAQPNRGSVKGSHWVEFEFDKVYRLGEMWIWNFNSHGKDMDHRIQGFKKVTIQYSATGRADPSEWKKIYEGQIPMAVSNPGDYASAVSLKVDFKDVQAKYVVITADESSDMNWADEKTDRCALSEVRFYPAKSAAK